MVRRKRATFEGVLSRPKWPSTWPRFLEYAAIGHRTTLRRAAFFAAAP